MNTSLLALLFVAAYAQAAAQTTSSAPPNTVQVAEASTPVLAREEVRLQSNSVEERIDAVLRLGALRRADASRLAAAALSDSSSRVRAAATRAVRALPPADAARALLPLLRDRDEFVRQEAAYTLGETGKSLIVEEVVTALLSRLEDDKSAGVRGAAAVSLGRIGDERAVPGLIASLSEERRAGGFLNRVRRRRSPENEFVRRSIARSLGLIGDRRAVPILINMIGNERAEADVRREAARSLGMLGDAEAIPALRAVEQSPDALLSRVASESRVQLEAANAPRAQPPSR